LGVEIGDMVRRFNSGVRYFCGKDEYQKDYALITTQFGFLNMPPEHLEGNLEAILKDVNQMRPKRTGKFITRVFLKCPPSGENLKIDPFVYIPEETINLGQKGKKAAAVETEAEPDDDVKEAATAV
jgi:large subunit ribosomal protein L1